MARSIAPIIGIPACTRALDGHPFNVVGEKYIAAAAYAAKGLPLGLQLIGRPLDEGTLVSLGGVIEEAAQFKARPQRWW